MVLKWRTNSSLSRAIMTTILLFTQLDEFCSTKEKEEKKKSKQKDLLVFFFSFSFLYCYHRSNRHAAFRAAQLAFKDLMIHRRVQFTLRIASSCVLHRSASQDIHCQKLCYLVVFIIITIMNAINGFLFMLGAFFSPPSNSSNCVMKRRRRKKRKKERKVCRK